MFACLYGKRCQDTVRFFKKFSQVHTYLSHLADRVQDIVASNLLEVRKCCSLEREISPSIFPTPYSRSEAKAKKKRIRLSNYTPNN